MGTAFNSAILMKIESTAANKPGPYSRERGIKF